MCYNNQVKKKTISQIQKELWQLCRQVANKIYVSEDGLYRCYTCNKLIEGSNKQLGHFLPKSTCGAYLKYSLDNLRWQCYNCNINGGGQGAIFYKKLVEEKGQEYVDKLFLDKQKSIKAIDHYLMLCEEYKSMLE